MSFETFQQLPSHNLQIPEFHPASIPAPPVYNTTEMIKPLLHLAEYLSPEARAKRKAAVAKANYEYREYTKGTPGLMKDKLFYQRLRFMQSQIDRNKALTRKADRPSKSTTSSPNAQEISKRAQRDKLWNHDMLDMTSDSTPPAASDDGGDTEEQAQEMVDSGDGNNL